jgi:hypothetical protein
MILPGINLYCPANKKLYWHITATNVKYHQWIKHCSNHLPLTSIPQSIPCLKIHSYCWILTYSAIKPNCTQSCPSTFTIWDLFCLMRFEVLTRPLLQSLTALHLVLKHHSYWSSLSDYLVLNTEIIHNLASHWICYSGNRSNKRQTLSSEYWKQNMWLLKMGQEPIFFWNINLLKLIWNLRFWLQRWCCRGLQGCDTMWYCRWLPAFQRNMPLPSSRWRPWYSNVCYCTYLWFLYLHHIMFRDGIQHDFHNIYSLITCLIICQRIFLWKKWQVSWVSVVQQNKSESY